MTSFFSTAHWQLIIYSLATLYTLFLFNKKNNTFLEGSRSWFYGGVLSIFAWLYIGTRPLWCYWDTHLYTTIYNLVYSHRWHDFPTEGSEWFWSWICRACVKFTNASGWLTVVALGYIGGMCWAAWRWFRNHFTLAVFFLFTAFSFWGYATNGIRNGLATSLMLLALAYITPECRKRWIKLIPAIGLMILSTGTHNTMYLLVATSMIAFLFPSRKNAFIIWGICLLLSPFSTGIITGLVGGFIDDNRFEHYRNLKIKANMFSHTGWRWDFIIYSSMPIILGWYAIIKKKCYDWTYVFLLNIYIYSNAFWLLINEVAFSNRFAYLSWFMYPVVLLMPLVKFRLWSRQAVVTGGILLGCIAFSLIF